MQIALYDIAGRVVYKANGTASDYDNKTTFELPGLAPGMYIAKYIIGQEIKEVKLLVSFK
jgi:hypothetical protein